MDLDAKITEVIAAANGRYDDAGHRLPAASPARTPRGTLSSGCFW